MIESFLNKKKFLVIENCYRKEVSVFSFNHFEDIAFETTTVQVFDIHCNHLLKNQELLSA